MSKYNFEFNFDWVNSVTESCSHNKNISAATISYFLDESFGDKLSTLFDDAFNIKGQRIYESIYTNNDAEIIFDKSNNSKFIYRYQMYHEKMSNRSCCYTNNYTDKGFICQGIRKKVTLKVPKALRQLFNSKVKDSEIDEISRALVSLSSGTFKFILINLDEAMELQEYVKNNDDDWYEDENNDLESCIINPAKWRDNFNPYYFYKDVVKNTALVFCIYTPLNTAVSPEYSRFLIHALPVKEGGHEGYAVAVNRIYGNQDGVFDALKGISPYPLIKLRNPRDIYDRSKRKYIPLGKFFPDNILTCPCPNHNKLIPYFDCLVLQYRSNIMYGVVQKLPTNVKLFSHRNRINTYHYSEEEISGSEYSGCRCITNDYEVECSYCEDYVSEFTRIDGRIVCDSCNEHCSICRELGANTYARLRLEGGVTGSTYMCPECTENYNVCRMCYYYFEKESEEDYKRYCTKCDDEGVISA